jgi:hypothetical protein
VTNELKERLDRLAAHATDGVSLIRPDALPRIGTRKHGRLVALAALGVAAVATTLIVRLDTEPVRVAAGPQADETPHQAAIASREDAIGRVRALTAQVRRIDESEARRVSWSEIAPFVEASSLPAGIGPDAPVWAVAITGEIQLLRHPPGINPPLHHWGVYIFDARTGSQITAASGLQRRWPEWFDGLHEKS